MNVSSLLFLTRNIAKNIIIKYNSGCFSIGYNYCFLLLLILKIRHNPGSKNLIRCPRAINLSNWSSIVEKIVLFFYRFFLELRKKFR